VVWFLYVVFCSVTVIVCGYKYLSIEHRKFVSISRIVYFPKDNRKLWNLDRTIFCCT